MFGTKNRAPLLKNAIQPEMFAYLGGICRKLGCKTYCVGGTDNHVHIACTLPRTLTVSKLMEEVKKSSSVWIKNKGDMYRTFAWQAGYGAFSLGKSQLPQVIKYIENQSEHHRSRNFREEFIELLERYGIEHDNQYLWD